MQEGAEIEVPSVCLFLVWECVCEQIPVVTHVDAHHSLPKRVSHPHACSLLCLFSLSEGQKDKKLRQQRGRTLTFFSCWYGGRQGHLGSIRAVRKTCMLNKNINAALLYLLPFSVSVHTEGLFISNSAHKFLEIQYVLVRTSPLPR